MDENDITTNDYGREVRTGGNSNKKGEVSDKTEEDTKKGIERNLNQNYASDKAKEDSNIKN